MKREPGLSLIMVEMHFAHVDGRGYLSHRTMSLRIPLPIGSSIYEVESVEYRPDGTIDKVEHGTIEQLLRVLTEAKEERE